MRECFGVAFVLDGFLKVEPPDDPPLDMRFDVRRDFMAGARDIVFIMVATESGHIPVSLAVAESEPALLAADDVAVARLDVDFSVDRIVVSDVDGWIGGLAAPLPAGPGRYRVRGELVNHAAARAPREDEAPSPERVRIAVWPAG
ncbi:hypothetical protein CLV72_1011240 [Allonocardiopsis opalescens]|uniref:Uncharacterized protein n=2 Tax=Allonocardiopsis opalescens TaxID=1144618 RepID=A0A2T0QFC4_9ACTN|nr:hypothetical protein CLV72_1011240 [Allonocardiopsis opalescens]